MSAMVGRLCIHEAKIIDANRCEAETKSLRNYQSLLREIITFLDFFNEKILGAELHNASTMCKTP